MTPKETKAAKVTALLVALIFVIYVAPCFIYGPMWFIGALIGSGICVVLLMIVLLIYIMAENIIT